MEYNTVIEKFFEANDLKILGLVLHLDSQLVVFQLNNV